MIVGNGDIASVLVDRDDVVFLASGLSNSQKVTEAEGVREIGMILNYRYPKKHIVYFSSLSVYYSDSDYAKYKKGLENVIINMFDSYTIVRLGNINWGVNPNTLLNYLKAHPEAERRDEIRYLVDKEEFLHWMSLIRVGTKDIMNIAGRMVNVKDL